MKRPDTHRINSYLQKSIIPDGPLRGGLRDSFHLKRNEFDFIYTETTGYAITYFSNLARRGDTQAKEVAIDCANFLTEHLVDDSLPYSYSIHDGSPSQRHFTFDNAICLSGLVDVYQITNNQAYLAAAQRIVNWLRTMYIDGDDFYSCLNMRTGNRKHPGNNFADDRGCLHVKNVIGILKVSEILKDDELEKWAVQILNTGLSRQSTSGAFSVQRDVPTIFSHAHAYITEGYLFGYLKLQDPRYLEVAQHSGKYLARAQSWNGGVHQFNRRGVCASDATSQAMRIWITLDLLEGKKQYTDSIRRAAEYLARMQFSGSGEVNGSILYTLSPFFRKSPMAYSWVGMFAGSAMNLLQSERADRGEIY